MIIRNKSTYSNYYKFKIEFNYILKAFNIFLKTLFITIFGVLFSVLNPFGTVPIFVGLAKEYTNLERNKIAFWTSLNILEVVIYKKKLQFLS